MQLHTACSCQCDWDVRLRISARAPPRPCSKARVCRMIRFVAFSHRLSLHHYTRTHHHHTAGNKHHASPHPQPHTHWQTQQKVLLMQCHSIRCSPLFTLMASKYCLQVLLSPPFASRITRCQTADASRGQTTRPQTHPCKAGVYCVCAASTLCDCTTPNSAHAAHMV